MSGDILAERAAKVRGEAAKPDPEKAETIIAKKVRERLNAAALTMEKAKELKNMEYVIDSLIPKGHHVYIYGPSGAGKTTVMHNLALSMAHKNYSVFFLYLDGDPMTAGIMMEQIEALKLGERYRIIYDLSAADALAYLEEIAQSGEDFKDSVFILDTFKFLTGDINNKNANKEAMHLIKAMKAASGATFISIGHTNKDGKNQSGTAEIEQDSDDLLRVDAETLPDGRIRSAITKGGRIRMHFKPRSFTFTPGRVQSCEQDDAFIEVDTKDPAEGIKEESRQEAIEEVYDMATDGKWHKVSKLSDALRYGPAEMAKHKAIDKVGKWVYQGELIERRGKRNTKWVIAADMAGEVPLPDHD